MRNLYPNIDAERARSGLTVGELAEKLGVTRKTYYNWLANGKIPQQGKSIEQQRHYKAEYHNV